MSRIAGEYPEKLRQAISLRGLLPRLWPIFITMWLVFVITGPIALMLEPPLTPLRMLGVLAWTAAFFTAYLWLTLHQPFREDELPARQRWLQVGLLGVLTALVLYVDLSYPAGWFWLFIYVTVPAGASLPTRVAIPTVIAITLLAAGVDVARGELAAAGSVPGTALWGFAAIMFRRMAILVQELQAAREELARLAVAEERLRFARDLHDLLGHSLSLITLKSELAARLLPRDRERAAAEIADVERVSRQALGEVREAVAGYRQPTLAGELDGVRELLAAAGIRTRIEVVSGPLPPAVDAGLAWVVREGVTNVIRHSRARHCDIRISRDDGIVRAEITDDGRGEVGGARGEGGNGLSGLAERIAGAGGRVTAGPSPAGGFRLSAALPVDDAPPAGEAARAPAVEAAWERGVAST